MENNICSVNANGKHIFHSPRTADVPEQFDDPLSHAGKFIYLFLLNMIIVLNITLKESRIANCKS